MTDIAYCTREMVQNALNQAGTTRSNARIDAAIRAAGNTVEGATRRRWYPTTATRYPDYRRQIQGFVLWLDTIDDEILTVQSFTCDGVALVEDTDFQLDPDGGPSYTSLRILDTSSAWFSAVDRGNVLAGTFGSSNTTRAAGEVVNLTTSMLTVSDSSLVGVGDLLTIGSERMNTIGNVLATTSVTLAGNVAASAATRSVTVSDGTLINEGETIYVGSEQMFVEAITGNVLTVRRAEYGSQLEAHSTSDVIYAGRTFVVERAVTGTTQASHSAGAAITANNPPALVQEFALAQSLVNLEQSRAAYGRVVGSGDNQRESSGRGLADIMDDLVTRYGRVKSGAA
jgi:hypothetical protein